MANSPMEPSLADHVPAVTNRESPAWVRPASLTTLGLLAPEVLGRLSPSRTLRLRFLSPQKCPDKLQSKNSCGQKGEKTCPSTLLKGNLPKSIQASGLFTKPNCIVYIIHLQRADKENCG